jgi:hypothetical protein
MPGINRRAASQAAPAPTTASPARRVTLCLPYEGMLEVPDAYNDWCLQHYQDLSRSQPDVLWEDACPAYALALATRGSYSLADGDSLEILWEELSGLSALDWPRARSILGKAWLALDQLFPPAQRAH